MAEDNISKDLNTCSSFTNLSEILSSDRQKSEFEWVSPQVEEKFEFPASGVERCLNARRSLSMPAFC